MSGPIALEITGAGAESALIEESSEFINWGTAYSFSSPAKLVS